MRGADQSLCEIEIKENEEIHFIIVVGNASTVATRGDSSVDSSVQLRIVSPADPIAARQNQKGHERLSFWGGREVEIQKLFAPNVSRLLGRYEENPSG
jgi:hypothetical protein